MFFLGYWKNEEATRAKFTGDWCRTGDLAMRDEDGYLWYQGRADDMFKAAGYRIGPAEIENCLVKHPAVANAAVVPKPDRGARRHGQGVRRAARPARSRRPALEAEIRRRTCAAGWRPTSTRRRSSSSTQLPMTTTGKVQRRVLRLREEERKSAGTA